MKNMIIIFILLNITCSTYSQLENMINRDVEIHFNNCVSWGTVISGNEIALRGSETSEKEVKTPYIKVEGRKLYCSHVVFNDHLVVNNRVVSLKGVQKRVKTSTSVTPKTIYIYRSVWGKPAYRKWVMYECEVLNGVITTVGRSQASYNGLADGLYYNRKPLPTKNQGFKTLVYIDGTWYRFRCLY